MKLTLNGSIAELPFETVAELLLAQGIDPGRKGVAVAVNGRIVPRRAWEETPLREGDRVEVITAMQGG